MTTSDVFVSPKPALNDEYLKQNWQKPLLYKIRSISACKVRKMPLLKEIASVSGATWKTMIRPRTGWWKVCPMKEFCRQILNWMLRSPRLACTKAKSSFWCLNKNKDLLASSEGPEALERPKTSSCWLLYLKEDKPDCVFVDSATEWKFNFQIRKLLSKGLKVGVVEANAAEKKPLQVDLVRYMT